MSSSASAFSPGAVALALLLAAHAFVGARLREWQEARRPAAAATEARLKADPALLRAGAAGHWPALVDWLWIRSLAEPPAKADRARRAGISSDLDAASELDPAFHGLYLGGAQLLAVVLDDGAGARDLLLKAERFRKGALQGYPEAFRREHWGAEWDIPLMLAYVQLYELGDIRAAARHFEEAARIPGAPRYLLALSERFGKPGGEYEVALRLVQFMLDGARDERVRDELEARRDSLRVGRFLQEVNRGLREFLERTREPDPEKGWRRYAREASVPPTDPLGGRLSLDRGGRVVSSSPRQRVFGLE